MKKLYGIGLVVACALVVPGRKAAWGVNPSNTVQSKGAESKTAPSETSQPAAKPEKGAPVQAKGEFDVKVTPQPPDEKGSDPLLGRMSIDKHYHGDLEATGVGQMLTGGDYKTGSAGYVAMEKVSGTLKGQKGTFLIQHTGMLNKGAATLSIIIVPDTGTGQLVGIAGKMDVKITDGKHFYELEYTLPEAKPEAK